MRACFLPLPPLPPRSSSFNLHFLPLFFTLERLTSALTSPLPSSALAGGSRDLVFSKEQDVVGVFGDAYAQWLRAATDLAANSTDYERVDVVVRNMFHSLKGGTVDWKGKKGRSMGRTGPQLYCLLPLTSAACVRAGGSRHLARPGTCACLGARAAAGGGVVNGIFDGNSNGRFT